jgi:radical SAM protein with 4Fe4S-binding SPASM domain
MQIETGSYTEFSQAVHVNAMRVPVNGTIEVSHRCPLNCAHCYNNLPMGDADARRREMTTEDHYRLLDEIAEMGCLWLLYSGGEIFARRDFLDIYTYAKRKGLIVSLFTNGTMITEAIADYLVEWRPFAIEITLYGATRETYERLTRIPGSYDRCMRGVQILLDRKLPLALKTVGVTINKHEVAAMRKIAEDLGVEFKFDAMLNPRIDCSASPLAVRLAPHKVVELDLEDPLKIAEWRRLAIHHAPPPVVEGEPLELYDCGGGMNSWALDPYGDLSICVLSHVDRYNVVKGSFRDGWDFLANVHRKPVTRPTKCTNCALRSLCGMCAANGELENNDPEAPVDWLCQTAHLRAMTFDVDVRPHGDCEYCPEGERHEIVRMTAEALRKGGSIPLAAAAATTLPPLPAATACGSGGCSSCATS